MIVQTRDLTTQATALLKELIAIPSFSRQEDKTADCIEAFLGKREIRYQRLKNNLWAFNQYFHPDKPTILLNSHHDTVKPNPSWTLDPFQPLVNEGKLYGLGSNDAGGCLVSLIAAFCHYYDHPELKYNLVMAATAEEEISGTEGLEMILPETLGPVKMSVTIINAGSQHNVVPDTCTFTIDVRTTDKYTNEEVLAVLQQNLKSEVKPRSVRLTPSSISPGHPIVQAGVSMGLQTYGSPTTSDQALLRCPSLKMGPGDSARSHTANEYIHLSEIEHGIRTYIEVLGRVVLH
jgi:acetylornithine deacetylase